jgi:hypothetical protein
MAERLRRLFEDPTGLIITVVLFGRRYSPAVGRRGDVCLDRADRLAGNQAI